LLYYKLISAEPVTTTTRVTTFLTNGGTQSMTGKPRFTDYKVHPELHVDQQRNTNIPSQYQESIFTIAVN
jgi:hypothetical protein